MKTLYQTLVEANIKISNHYSDLYFEKNEKSSEIVKKFPDITIKTFRNQVTGTIWYESPFQFTPYWDSKINT